MRWIAGVFFVMMFGVLGGCTLGQSSGYVDASAWSANYTEDYIHDFWIQTVEGKDTGLEGIQVKEFSKGGTGGSECCSLIPGVGQTIKVMWRIGGRQDDRSEWKTYSKDVVVIGAMPKKKDSYNILMVRFFDGRQVEAELIPDRGETGLPSPRVDKVFSGRRVMRHLGE
ncbi:DUF3304 domain-containing protein [Paraburkholderia sp. EG287A]|uniref:DUF3304 domain-containing protein n=1 Tax=unclassified Paraburkholderia TaxID=2615204 RepID=UPI0034D2A37B